jgi:adenylylsulfate kinase
LKNIQYYQHVLTKAERAACKQQLPFVIWFTGLSASGKSTLANALEIKLHSLGHHTYILDGDNVRHGLNSDLGFSNEDRIENIRRIGETAKLFTDAGIIVICAFISPFKADRQIVRDLMKQGEFIEVYLNTSLEICEQRDPKALYKKARNGEIKFFTGIDSEYQIPEYPELCINTNELDVDTSINILVDYLIANNLIYRHLFT